MKQILFQSIIFQALQYLKYISKNLQFKKETKEKSKWNRKQHHFQLKEFSSATVHEEVVSAGIRPAIFLPPLFSVWCGCETGGRQTSPLHRQYAVLVRGSVPLHHRGQFNSKKHLGSPHRPHPLWVWVHMSCHANLHWLLHP